MKVILSKRHDSRDQIEMLTPEQLEQAQAEVDEAYVTEMRYELDLILRQSIVDWAQGISDRLGMAAYSAVNGRWDDIQKDIQRERITSAQAIMLLDKFLECRLITSRQYDWFKQKFSTEVTNA